MDSYKSKFPKLRNMMTGSFHNYWPEDCQNSGREVSFETVDVGWVERSETQYSKQAVNNS
jgi:hypothetical protein